MKFDCILTTVDFLSNTTDFQSFEQLTEKIYGARLETWYEYPLRHIIEHESKFRH